MKDIGFGILDRYTVIIVIIVLALANFAFGLEIPLDTSNATQLVFSLVIFTGYLYLARSLVRLPVAIIKATIVVQDTFGTSSRRYQSFWEILLEKVMDFFLYLRYLPFTLYFTFLLILDFSNPQFDKEYPSKRISKIKKRTGFINSLAIIDRLSVILIVIAALLEETKLFVEVLGIVGASMLLLVFLFKGNFSALLQDELLDDIKKDETPLPTTIQAEDAEKQDESYTFDIDVTGEKEERLEIASIKISNCQNCNKVCAENAEGDLPQFCSLVCRQEWFPTWERDWCSGQERERQIIEAQRVSGYADLERLETATDELKEIMLKQRNRLEAFWTLLGMVRDISSGDDYLWRSERIYPIERAILDIIKEKPFAVNALLQVLLDANSTLVLFAVKILAEHPRTSDKVNDTNIRSLLNHTSWQVRRAAIPLLGNLGRYEELLAHLSKMEILDSMAIIEIFQSQKEIGNVFLTRAQKHPVRSIRHDATEALFEMGIKAKKPDIVEQYVECPNDECRAPVKITYPTTYLSHNFKGVERLGILSIRKFKARCSVCRARIGLKLDSTFIKMIHSQNEEWYAKLLKEYANDKDITEGDK
jgi:hypothetical protein